MADAKVASPPPTVTPGKIAMSRSLGAAFLAHQVEQLEKTVDARGYAPRGRNNGRRAPTGRGSAPMGNNGRAPKFAVRGGGPPQARQDKEKDADIVVVDASVLIHALGYVKRWFREGREEIIIVPLEALNTLDLLKKGTSILAQRARAASRALEAQVGVNPRVRVQQDAAFVPWDSITLSPTPDGEPVAPAPEWLRRTICCAQYEVSHAAESDKHKKPTVIFATLAHAPVLPRAPSPAVGDSPVPLPAPQANKHELRATGVLANYWAQRAGLAMRAIEPSQEPGTHPNGHGNGNMNGHHQGQRRSSSEEETHPNINHRGQRRRTSAAPDTAEKTRSLVERPPAVKAMMDSVAQPSRAIRVLARGEKLEP